MATLRKSTAAMSAAEWTAFKSAVSTLISNGKYHSMVMIHHNMKHHMHSAMSMHGMQMSDPKGRQRFLPWHRAFVLHFEAELQNVTASVFVPYWDWITQRGIPPQLDNFLGLSSGRNDPPLSGDLLPKQNTSVHWPTALGGGVIADMNSILALPDYMAFSGALEDGPHNYLHNWVGGAMGDPTISPEDPIFWMHHGNIDRLWSIWETNNPGKLSTATGKLRTLDPWKDTIATVNDIGALGYSYQ
jgi:tyrosinase